MRATSTRWGPRRLSTKLTIPFIAVLVSALTVLGVVSTRSVRTAMTQSLDKRAEIFVNLLATSLADPLSLGEVERLQQLLDKAKQSDPDVVYATLVDAKGTAVASTDSTLKGQVLLRNDFEKVMVQVVAFTRRPVPDALSLFEVATPVKYQVLGKLGTLRIGFTTAYIDRTVLYAEYLILIVGLTALLLGTGLYIYVARVTARPLREAVASLEELARGERDLTRRIDVHTNDETGALSQAFNIMAEALQRRQAETERNTRELQALNAIATATSRSLDLKELFEIALAKTVEVTERVRINIRLKDPLTGKANMVAYQGFTEEEVEELHRRTPHHPMSEQVFASGNPLIVNDSGENRSLNLLKQTRSVAWIPIKAGARVVGVLGISDDQSNPFSPSEVKFLEAIGNVIGVAIENARLFGETKRSLEGIRALHEIDMAITSTLDLRDVLGVLLEKIDLFLPYSTATVRLFNKESGLLEPVACWNLDEEEWRLEEWKAGRGPANVVFETKAPMTIRNCYNDPRVRDPGFFRKHELVSYLGVPMIAKEEILGVLSFYTKEEHEFTSEEVEFLTTLAGQAAIAIHNAWLYGEVRQKMQELQQKTADLERANKVKDEFLSVMSHELRTPLNVVMGYTGMIKDGVLGEINLEQEKALEKIMRRAGEQLSMIASILLATQLEVGEIKVEPQKVWLGEFLDDLKSGNLGSFAKKVALKWDYPSNLPPLRTDTEKLKHILENLIDNALKFTEEGLVKVSVRSHDSVVDFQVIDTGVGIAAEHLPTIFERFHQLDSSETRVYGGIGMGLYIAKKFTDLLGGQIRVESRAGEGSTFTVTMPSESYQAASGHERAGTAILERNA